MQIWIKNDQAKFAYQSLMSLYVNFKNSFKLLKLLIELMVKNNKI